MIIYYIYTILVSMSLDVILSSFFPPTDIKITGKINATNLEDFQ